MIYICTYTWCASHQWAQLHHSPTLHRLEPWMQAATVDQGYLICFVGVVSKIQTPSDHEWMPSHSPLERQVLPFAVSRIDAWRSLWDILPQCCGHSPPWSVSGRVIHLFTFCFYYLLQIFLQVSDFSLGHTWCSSFIWLFFSESDRSWCGSDYCDICICSSILSCGQYDTHLEHLLLLEISRSNQHSLCGVW